MRDFVITRLCEVLSLFTKPKIMISFFPMCPITVDEIKEVDLILVTHGAFDHLGDAIEICKRTKAILMTEPAVRVHAIKSGVAENRIKLLGWGFVREELGLKIRAVENRHISFFKTTDQCITGHALSFIVYTESNIGVYHLGDTYIFSDLQLIGQLYIDRKSR